MIYLFNSAYHTTYFENIYRLLGLPPGVRVDMRYTEDVNAPGVNTDSEMKDHECIICYVDRFNDYIYYPLRKGIIRSIKRDQGRVFYSIELAKHCNSPSAETFTAALKKSASTSPRLTNNDPGCGQDGEYCVIGPNLENLINESPDSWSQAVDQIYSSTSFLKKVPALFLVDIEQNEKKPKGSECGLNLHANTEYKLTLYYKYPIEREDAAQRRVLVRMGTEINRELAVGSDVDRLVIPINLPPLDFSAGAIIIETVVEDKGSTGGDVRYTATVPFQTQAWRSNLFLFGLLFLVSFLSEFRKVDWNLQDVNAWFSAFFEFLKFGIVIWAVFKYRGKLKLPGL